MSLAFVVMGLQVLEAGAMDSTILMFSGLRKCRTLIFGAGVAIILFPVGLCYGQTTDAKDESRPGAGDTALVPPVDGPPLTAREEEMLRLIKGLQDRVALLEARSGSEGSDVQPAAQGSSQARLLKASIVSLPDKSAGAATLAVPTFHTKVSATSGPASTINPANGMSGGQEQPKMWGAYTPNLGYKVANTELGDMSISIYSYIRYLNQKNPCANLYELLWRDQHAAATPGCADQQGADQVSGLGSEPKDAVLSLCLDFERVTGTAGAGSSRWQLEL